MVHTVYAVASGKGGVGKTTTTVNLGAALAERGHSVAIVDADLGMANLGGFLGLDPEGATLHEVLAGEAELGSAVYEVSPGLAAVPSGISLDGFASVETEVLSEAIDGLREEFDYVLLDLGAGLSHDTVLPLALADAVILVSTPKPVALQDTAKTRQITERLGGAVAGVVLTRASDPWSLDFEGISEQLELPVLAVVQEDEVVDRSALAGVPLLREAPDAGPTASYRGLADVVIAESLERAPVVPEPPTPDDGPDDPTAEAGSESDSSAPADGEAASSDPQARTEPDAAGGAEAASTAGESTSDPTAGKTAGESPADAGGTPGEDPLADEQTGDPADGTADEDPAGVDADEDDEEAVPVDPETEAAAEEIAAAIEEAAEEPGDAMPTGEFDDGGPASLPEDGGPADADEDDHEDEGERDGDDETSDAEESDDEGGEADENEETFSVEGAEPDEEEEDEEEESGGLLSRFFG
jgi:septum site-determining protein MinD